MTTVFKRLRRRFRKDQAGQSIVLLAFAFIALAAFVGLVTDISVLFVRYSTLRRTIDSAAVAAAGQIREGTDYGTVALTAKQFIQLHGLEPSRVWVETCETDILAWRTGTGIFEGQGSNPESADPPDTSISDLMPETELCDWDSPRKLVRVRAQIESETFFLRLLGIENLTLEASSVSETAVLDIALVLDTSQSMATSTTVAMYDAVYTGGVSYPYTSRPECFQDFGGSFDDLYYKYGPCCNDPGQGQVQLNEVTGLWEIIGINSPAATAKDSDFSDLVCHPFRDVKDAARNFIGALDYVRGDRVSLVTFDSDARIVQPIGNPADILMMSSELQAVSTLDQLVGVNPQDQFPGKVSRISRWNDCPEFAAALIDFTFEPQASPIGSGVAPQGGVLDNPGLNPDLLRPMSYESVAPCNDTNLGGGLRAANDALTNLATIRRDAVWVIILLTDGAANRTDVVPETTFPNYGTYGFCPWYTFCDPGPATHPYKLYANDTLYQDLTPAQLADPLYAQPSYALLPDNVDPGVSNTDRRSECPDGQSADYPLDITTGFVPPFCNDNNPNTRHFCLEWTGDPATNGRPDLSNPTCVNFYDADDYARDWADFAGLIRITETVPGNFITIFTIGFGDNLVIDGPDKDAFRTSAPLLRYIADAGDNGFIDNDLQQDFRDNGANDGSVPPSELGDPDPCEAFSTLGDEDEQCGQYYYADDLRSVDAVFEAIASRLFTRIAR